MGRWLKETIRGGKRSAANYKMQKNVPTILQIRRRTFWRVESASPSPMLGIVMYKHVVGDSQDMAVNIDGRRYDNLQREWEWSVSLINEKQNSSIRTSVLIGGSFVLRPVFVRFLAHLCVSNWLFNQWNSISVYPLHQLSSEPKLRIIDQLVHLFEGGRPPF